MNVASYLNRIGYSGATTPGLLTLMQLHEQHMKLVPFENLDIHYKRPFTLALDEIFNKVVSGKRGGFCYEVNLLFNELLTMLGFQSRTIAARIYRDNGDLGPALDHMSVNVTLEKDYLVDVGFGDLFVRPLEIGETDVQFDGRSYFRIAALNNGLYDISMSRDNVAFEKKYQFAMSPVDVRDFEPHCIDKQVNPESHFVRNTICTRITDNGRITIFNEKLTERTGAGPRIDTMINSDEELRMHLREKFGIEIP
jgi:N-hydroxyarylamine O-acetyltransferase